MTSLTAPRGTQYLCGRRWCHFTILPTHIQKSKAVKFKRTSSSTERYIKICQNEPLQFLCHTPPSICYFGCNELKRPILMSPDRNLNPNFQCSCPFSHIVSLHALDRPVFTDAFSLKILSQADLEIRTIIVKTVYWYPFHMMLLK